MLLLQINEVVLTIQTGSRGTQACINAAGTIDSVIADLETTVMFAAAGTLNPEPGETFANHRFVTCDRALLFCSPPLQCFDTVGWVIIPVKTVGRITYIVLVQTLNHAQSKKLQKLGEFL